MITEKLLDRTDELTDEKMNFIDEQKKASDKAGIKFDYQSQSDIWYTLKIAELQLIQEKIINALK